jgi:diguanylate cyclase
MLLLIDILAAIVVAGGSAMAGWWLRGRPEPAPSASNGADLDRAREVLAQLHEVTARVAADVGDHNSRVKEINDELNSIDGQETNAVVGVVAKLVEANNQMKQRLTSAEGKLQEQNRLIEWHAAEARTDVLTGLANRRALDDAMALRVAEFQRCGRGFSVVMIDVDHFKRFNDSYGHQAGDEVLRRLGQMLRRTAREMDFVARYGGEEFTLLFPGATVEEAVLGAERIRRAVEGTKFPFEGAELQVTVSLGVAQLLSGEEGTTVIKRSDEALYASKDGGRNVTYWHDGEDVHKVRGREVETPKKPAPPPAAPAAGADDADSASGRAGVRSPAMRNRTAFCVDLGRRVADWERGGPTLAVLLVKVDRYPELAAVYGDQVAALILRTTAQFLAAVTRDAEMVAEYDQATFAVQLPAAELLRTITIIERLREAVARCTLPTDRGPLRITISIGGAEVIEGDKLERLLGRAGEALEAAIHCGGNAGYFHNGQWSETVRAVLERLKVSC